MSRQEKERTFGRANVSVCWDAGVSGGPKSDEATA